MIGNRQFSRCGFALLLLMMQSNLFAAHLIVAPSKLELTGSDPLHGIVVSLTHDDGKVSDVTRRASYEMDRADIASADERGMITGLADGQATLTVKLAELSATVSISVATFADKPAPSFKHDVLPILTRSGCNMGGCHGKLAGQNGFRLSLRGYAPEWDHDWITQEVTVAESILGFLRKVCCWQNRLAQYHTMAECGFVLIPGCGKQFVTGSRRELPHHWQMNQM